MSTPEIKPQTKQELAQAYGISPRTLNRWLTPFQEHIGPRMGHTYTPKQIRIIYDLLGSPISETSDDA